MKIVCRSRKGRVAWHNSLIRLAGSWTNAYEGIYIFDQWKSPFMLSLTLEVFKHSWPCTLTGCKHDQRFNLQLASRQLSLWKINSFNWRGGKLLGSVTFSSRQSITLRKRKTSCWRENVNKPMADNMKGEINFLSFVSSCCLPRLWHWKV